jgi:hypothetical protein
MNIAWWHRFSAPTGGVEVFLEIGDASGDASAVEFLHAAADGRFSLTASEQLLYGGDQPVLSTDGSGYVFVANGGDASYGYFEAEVYTSPNGTTWTEETSALP